MLRKCNRLYQTLVWPILKYNSKFQEIRNYSNPQNTKTTKFLANKFLKINDYEKIIKRGKFKKFLV